MTGILESAKPAIIICARDRARSVAFYRDALGLRFVSEDQFAAIFDVAGTEMRISTVPDFVAHEHTILGFKVTDVEATVRALLGQGIVFNRYPHLKQDELGILTLPGGIRVAWFQDPGGNVLSVTNA